MWAGPGGAGRGRDPPPRRGEGQRLQAGDPLLVSWGALSTWGFGGGGGGCVGVEWGRSGVGWDARDWLQESPCRIQSLRAWDTLPAFHVLLNPRIYGFR